MPPSTKGWKNEVTLLGLGIGDDGQEAGLAFKERHEPRPKVC
jgi:hypothetical protein